MLGSRIFFEVVQRVGGLPYGIPYALEIPHATRVAQVGAREHAHLARLAATRHIDPTQNTHPNAA